MRSPTTVSLTSSRRAFLKHAAVLPFAGLAASGAGAPAIPAGTEARLAGPESPVIVDAHVHVWTHDPRYPWAPETTRPPEREATAEQLLALMRANGVSRAVIIQVIHYRWDNRYVAAVLRRHPGKFRGVARVNPQNPAAPDQLARLVAEDGFHGVRLSPAADASGDWIRGPLMEPLWGRCRDLRIPMTILAPIDRMPDVMRLAEKFPDLTVVIDHMADNPPDRPADLEKLLALRRFPRVWVKISHAWSLSKQTYPYLDAQTQIRRLYDSFGPRRLIAGTDWPLVESYCTYAEAIDLARSRCAFLTAEDKRWVCGLNAAEIWPANL